MRRPSSRLARTLAAIGLVAALAAVGGGLRWMSVAPPVDLDQASVGVVADD